MKAKRLLCLALVAVMLFTVGSVAFAAEISTSIGEGSVTNFDLRLTNIYPNFLFIKNITMDRQETLPLTVNWSTLGGQNHLYMRISGELGNDLTFDRTVVVYPGIAYNFLAPIEGTYTIELARPPANEVGFTPLILSGTLFHPWQFIIINPPGPIES